MNGFRSIPWARALAEFVTIVVAVYLGLLANDYRDYRAEKAAQREYLRLISRDLQRDLQQLGNTRRGIAAQARAAQLLQQWLGGADVSSDELDKALTNLFLTWTYQEQNPTFIGLRDSGRLNILEDPTTRSDVVDYYELRQKSLQDDYMAGYNQAQRRLAASLAKHVRFFPPDRFNDLRLSSYAVQDVTELRAATLVTPVTVLRSDLAFGNDIAEQGARGFELLAQIDGLAKYNQQLQAEVSASMK